MRGAAAAFLLAAGSYAPARRAHAGALRQGTDRDDTPDAAQSDRQVSDEVKPIA